MNEQDKAMRYCFFAGILVLFVFAYCYYGTSRVDGRRSEDVRNAINDSKSINTELQNRVAENKRTVDNSIQRLGSAEAELNRAECAITKCQQVLDAAKRRTQEASQEVK